MLNIRRYKHIVKALCCIVIVCFLYQNYVWAQGASGFRLKEYPAASIPDIISPISNISRQIENLRIPHSFGNVQKYHNGENGKLIIHIQDLHAHYEAQTNYAKIMSSLVENELNGGKKLVAMEGAVGPLSVKRFRIIPDPFIKKTLADYL